MFRKKGLEKSLAVFVLAIGLILFYSWNFAANIFYIGIALILLGIFSVFVLSDLLVTWAMILGVVIATLILIFDVTYLPDNQVLFLLYIFPVSAWLTSRVNFYLHQRLGLVQDDSEDAAEAYEEMVQKVNQKQAPAFQALLVHWAHNHHFYQIHSREYKRMLKRILRLLNWDFQNVETVYYVSNGNFLVLVEDLDQEVKEYFQEKVREDLTMMHFENKKTDQKIQFQSGSLKLNAQNIDKFHNFDDALSNLERQLETDIIVEY